MPEDTPEFTQTTIDGNYFVDPRPYNLPPSEDVIAESAVGGEDFIDVYPKEESGKGYHPYELEINVGQMRQVELRCYYGTLYYSIAAIQVQATPIDDSAADADKAWGIKGQSELPGLGNITPASFINQDKGTSTKYATFQGGTLKSDGTIPDSCIGDVYLEFFLDSQNHAITEATIKFIPEDDPIPQEQPCGKLEVENDKLMRRNPKGKYFIKIGSFNNPMKSRVPITQCIEDHQYYATTIIDNSAAPDIPPDDPEYAVDNIPDDDETEQMTAADPVKDAESIIPGADRDVDTEESLVIPDVDLTPPVDPTVNPHTTYGQEAHNETYGPHQPNHQIRLRAEMVRHGTGLYDPDNTNVSRDAISPEQTGDFADELEVPATEHPTGAFGGTGAAGSAATSDGTGYIQSGSISSISSIIALQRKSPQGSPGGSPSSGSFST